MIVCVSREAFCHRAAPSMSNSILEARVNVVYLLIQCRVTEEKKKRYCFDIIYTHNYDLSKLKPDYHWKGSGNKDFYGARKMSKYCVFVKLVANLFFMYILEIELYINSFNKIAKLNCFVFLNRYN